MRLDHLLSKEKEKSSKCIISLMKLCMSEFHEVCYLFFNVLISHLNRKFIGMLLRSRFIEK